MLYFLPTKATIKRKQINMIEEKNCENKMKETHKHRQADIYVEDK